MLLIHQETDKHQRENLCKLKANAGTRTNVHQPATDNLRLEIKRSFLITGGEGFSCSLAGGALRAEMRPGNSSVPVAYDSRDWSNRTTGAPSPVSSLPKSFLGKPAHNDHEKQCSHMLLEIQACEKMKYKF